MRTKRKILALLGWHDVRTLLALARHARDAGWHLETRHFFDENLPYGWQGDGMIVSSPSRADVLRFIRRQAPRQPTVLIERNNPGLRVPQVAEDNTAAGRLAATHLLEMGHKHFAWWSPFQSPVAEERWQGFNDTLRESGCTAERLEYHSGECQNDWSRRRAWLVRRLKTLPRPLALFALDDQLASEAVEMCVEAKLNVPRDVAVVGVGNIELACETSHVPITSVDNAPDEIALAGAKLLDRLIAGGRPPRELLRIPPRGLVIRQSSATLAVTHPAIVRAVAFVRERLAKPLDVNQVAAAAGFSRRTLYNLFESELRCTPITFVHRERMARARAMLESSDASIKAICVACGFGTARTMIRLFRQTEGLSPRAWRVSRRSRRSLLD